LQKYRPGLVLGAFVPADAGVDEAVLACPSVRHYVLLGARIGGVFASAALWRDARWRARPLAEISRWMLTRHDVWLDDQQRRILQHGEAWQFSRVEVSELDIQATRPAAERRPLLLPPRHRGTDGCERNEAAHRHNDRPHESLSPP
jgi:hypothetical protein